MARRPTNSRLANLEANTIYMACAAFQSQFKAITGRAYALRPTRLARHTGRLGRATGYLSAGDEADSR
jgi:hypothetical protein